MWKIYVEIFELYLDNRLAGTGAAEQVFQNSEKVLQPNRQILPKEGITVDHYEASKRGGI